MRSLVYCIILTMLSGPLAGQKVKVFHGGYDQLIDSAASEYYVFVDSKFVKKPALLESDKEWNRPGRIDTVITYYTRTGKMRSRQIMMQHRRHGLYLFYHENGKVSERGLYGNGREVGIFTTYYPSGLPQASVNFSAPGLYPAIVNYWDSAGVIRVSKGNGFCNCYSLNDTYDRMEGLLGRVRQSADPNLRRVGKVVDGRRDSSWSFFTDGRLDRREIYINGNLNSGESYRNGKVYPYNAVQTQPEFVGGMMAMQKYIQFNVHYPHADKRTGAQGKVFIEFKINADGSLSEIKVLKGVTSTLDAEALRVVREMPRWKSASIRGVPMAMPYVIPINFRLRG